MSDERRMLWESGLTSITRGVVLNFIAPFALLYNASSFSIALISSMPNLVGSVVQLHAPRVAARLEDSRTYLLLFTALQAVAIAALLLVGLTNHAVPAILLLVMLYSTGMMMTNPVWVSYLGTLIPSKRWHAFFAQRQGIVAVSTFAATLVAGAVLTLWGSPGFVAIFLLATATQLVAANLYRGAKPVALPESRRFSLKAFLKRKTPFRTFVQFTTGMRFAAYIGAPFFVVYQLEVLNLGYARFTLLQLATVLASFLGMRLWSWLSARQGTKRVLLWAGVGMAANALLYLLSDAFVALLLFDIIGGLSWGGFNYGSTSYALEATSEKSRRQAITYLTMLNNVGVFAGSMVGGVLVTIFEGSGTPFLAIFALSGVGRLLAVLHWRPRLKEVGLVEVPLRHLPISLFVVPRQGMVPAPSPREQSQDLEQNVRRRKRFSRHHPRSTLERMSERERAIYTKQYVDRARK